MPSASASCSDSAISRKSRIVSLSWEVLYAEQTRLKSARARASPQKASQTSR